MDQRLYSDKDSRLQTTDEHGNRVYIHPEDLSGRWKDRRFIVYWILIGVYMLLPWIQFDGKQLILIDIPGREFTFFGTTLWAHDVPKLIFVLLGFIFLIGMITSIWGRVWCGWACPQTVFLDTIFRKIEAWVEGKSRQRMQLDQAPWSASKLFKKSLKWFLFTLVSLHIVHSFLGYFVGARNLFWITTQNPAANWSLFITMLVLTAIILFDFGWFREQFCIIMCPYGRLQSIVMDEDSLAVAYNESRGEPRKKIGVHGQAEGDCIDCHHCVRVCPTGIDIRRGLQMECIACTACIDACDNIMDKLNKPRGLISYTSENALAGRKSPALRPRTLVYASVLLIIMSLALVSFSRIGDIQTIVIRNSQDLYQIKNDGKIQNAYKAEFSYSGANEKLVYVQIHAKDRNKIKLISAEQPFYLKRERRHAVNIFFQFEKTLLNNGTYETALVFSETPGFEKPFFVKELTLVGPLK